MEDESKCVVFTEKQDKDTQQIFHVLAGRFLQWHVDILENGLALKRQAIH